MSKSVEISTLHLSHEDNIRSGQHLRTDKEESLCSEFGVSNIKYSMKVSGTLRIM